MFLPFVGKEAEGVVMRCKKRLFKLFKKDQKVEFRVRLQTTKLSLFTSNKVHCYVPLLLSTNTRVPVV